MDGQHFSSLGSFDILRGTFSSSEIFIFESLFGVVRVSSGAELHKNRILISGCDVKVYARPSSGLLVAFILKSITFPVIRARSVLQIVTMS